MHHIYVCAHVRVQLPQQGFCVAKPVYVIWLHDTATKSITTLHTDTRANTPIQTLNPKSAHDTYSVQIV
jgi:hypothetical protein